MYPTQQQNSTDQTANFFWLLCMAVGAFLLIWWLRRQWIIFPVMMMRIGEIDLLHYIITAWSDIASFLHFHTISTTVLDRLRVIILDSAPAKMSFSDFTKINVFVGSYIRWPIMIILLILAAIMHFFHTGARFRKTYSMSALKKQEVENWPQITPVLSLDLVKQDLDQGPWAMAKLPLDFAKEHEIVHQEVEQGKKVWRLSEESAYRVFALQVGPLWKGADALPIYMKAIAVIFMSRAERKGHIANKLMAQISASAASGKLDFTGVQEQFDQFKSGRIIQWLETRHSYVYTLMSTMLEIARTNGVLATAEFLWLKPVDRRLWYVLNSVGRQTAVVEVAGAFAHWLAEKRVGKPLTVPMVRNAVVALEIDIKETLHIGDDERWQSFAA